MDRPRTFPGTSARPGRAPPLGGRAGPLDYLSHPGRITAGQRLGGRRMGAGAVVSRRQYGRPAGRPRTRTRGAVSWRRRGGWIPPRRRRRHELPDRLRALLPDGTGPAHLPGRVPASVALLVGLPFEPPSVEPWCLSDASGVRHRRVVPEDHGQQGECPRLLRLPVRLPRRRPSGALGAAHRVPPWVGDMGDMSPTHPLAVGVTLPLPLPRPRL